MLLSRRAFRVLLLITLLMVTLGDARGQVDPTTADPAVAADPSNLDARRQVDPASKQDSAVTSLPEIDPAIHDAMQSRAYGDAVKLIETRLEKTIDCALDYLRYLQGIALDRSKAIRRCDFSIRGTGKRASRQSVDQSLTIRTRTCLRFASSIHSTPERSTDRKLSVCCPADARMTLCKIYLEFADRYFDGSAGR